MFQPSKSKSAEKPNQGDPVDTTIVTAKGAKGTKQESTEEQLLKMLKNDLDEAERENTLMHEDNKVLKDELQKTQNKLRVGFFVIFKDLLASSKKLIKRVLREGFQNFRSELID